MNGCSSRALRRAALHAALAPSVYNTQPWTLELAPSRLQLNADPSRWLPSLDSQARQLALSVGCAVFNARAAMAAARLGVVVDRSSDVVPANLAATLTVHRYGPEPSDAALAELSRYVERRTDRPAARAAADDVAFAHRLEAVCRAEGARFLALSSPEHRHLLADLARRATDAGLVGHLGPAWQWARAFGPTIWSHARTRFDGDVLPGLLCTAGDTAADWLLAGECLQRVLLEVARSGYSAQIYITPIEAAELRSRLRDSVPVLDFPQVLMTIGPLVTPPQPRQRRLTEILRQKE